MSIFGHVFFDGDSNICSENKIGTSFLKNYHIFVSYFKVVTVILSIVTSVTTLTNYLKNETNKNTLKLNFIITLIHRYLYMPTNTETIFHGGLYIQSFILPIIL